MDIYPDDLAPADEARVQQWRVIARPGDITTFVGALLGIVPATFVTQWFTLAPDVTAGLLTMAAGTGYGLGYAMRCSVRKKQREKPMTTTEIEAIGKDEADLLRLEYMGLLSALVSGRSAQGASEAASTRAAVRDIGLGLVALPGQPPTDLLLNAGTLNTEAARLGAEAAGERDPVVAASLHRQAEARRQRAEAIGRSAALARRNDILRREMLEHVRALKTLCGAAALEDGGGNYDMTALVENIKQVASEAKSLGEARQELAAALPQIEPAELATVALTNTHQLT